MRNLGRQQGRHEHKFRAWLRAATMARAVADLGGPSVGKALLRNRARVALRRDRERQENYDGPGSLPKCQGGRA